MDSKPLVREHEDLIVSYWTKKENNKEKPSCSRTKGLESIIN